MIDTFEQLKIAIVRDPMVVSLDTQLLDTIVQMSGQSEIGDADAVSRIPLHSTIGSSYVVVVDREQVVGLLTERDVVRLVAQRLPLGQLTLRHVLGHPPVTVRESKLADLAVVWNLFQQQQLSHLLILDDTDRLVGAIGPESLQQALGSVFLQAEIQRQRTHPELAQATCLKNEFLANMSHELRTPLNVILGMTEGLTEKVFGSINVLQIRALQTIERSGSHLLELIDKILDLAKIELGRIDLEYSPVSVTHLCQSSVTFLKQQSLKKRIQFHLNVPSNLPDVMLDAQRIQQVLVALLKNAVKFTPEGGQISLDVISLSPNEISHQNYLRFSVTDTGIGIAPENLEQLFQPFSQIDSSLNRKYEGTGLGLALVKQIVELHKGHVVVTSKVGFGSCFAIELPYRTVSASKSISKAVLASCSVTPEIERLTVAPLILLAEDNDANINTLSSYLRAKGYRIQAARNGQAAIELAQAELPSIILMDIQMPGMDGLAAIQHIRQLPTLAQTPLIVMTALALDENRERCLAVGADEYLSKPVKLKQLVAVIQALLTQRGND